MIFLLIWSPISGCPGAPPYRQSSHIGHRDRRVDTSDAAIIAYQVCSELNGFPPRAQPRQTATPLRGARRRPIVGINRNGNIGLSQHAGAGMRAQLTPTAVIIFAVATLLLACPLSYAQNCEGPTFQHHSTAPQEFDTNSHLEQGDYEYTTCITARSQKRKGEYWRIDRCVHNPDPKFPLHFSWFVPEWEAWVPPNCVLEYPHYLQSAPTAQSTPKLITSCIEYGNAGRMTTAQYLGDDAEQQAAANEDKSQCQPAGPGKLKASSADEAKLTPLAFETDLFFPSDAKYPEKTMLAMAASYSVAVEGNSYASTLDYRLTPGPNSFDAVPKLVRMRVLLRGEAERLTQFLSPQAKEPVRMQEVDSVRLLQVHGDGPWRLVHAVLQFFDQSDKPVAKAQVPVFVSAP
jgi:hypothetical protein